MRISLSWLGRCYPKWSARSWAPEDTRSEVDRQVAGVGAGGTGFEERPRHGGQGRPRVVAREGGFGVDPRSPDGFPGRAVDRGSGVTGRAILAVGRQGEDELGASDAVGQLPGRGQGKLLVAAAA